MNTNTSVDNRQPLNDAQLDALFARAVASQAELADDNFTRMVVNRLPTERASEPARRIMPDLIGLVIGMIGVLLVTNPRQIFSSIVAALPQSIVISPASVLIMATAMSACALFAWWAVEREG
jgi:hypothetical protein